MPKIKTHLYKVFIRPTLTYGFENYVLNKAQIKKLQTTEATMVKKMLNLNKTSRTTNLLSALDIEKMEEKIIKLKNGFMKRIMGNNLTQTIIKELENKVSEISELSNKSILKEMAEYAEESGLNIHEINQSIDIKLKELRKSVPNGISDSIKLCLENIGQETYRKLLVELTRSY